MAGVANTWTQADAGVAGHPIPVMTLSADPKITLVFMRLPDGNIDGSGFASTGFTSLQKLYQGSIPQMTADDGSSSYTLGALISTLSSLITSFKPDTIWTQDYVGTYGDGDHSDHHTVAYITREASRAWTSTTHTLTGYMDYTTAQPSVQRHGHRPHREAECVVRLHPVRQPGVPEHVDVPEHELLGAGSRRSTRSGRRPTDQAMSMRRRPMPAPTRR